MSDPPVTLDMLLHCAMTGDAIASTFAIARIKDLVASAHAAGRREALLEQAEWCEAEASALKGVLADNPSAGTSDMAWGRRAGFAAAAARARELAEKEATK